MSRSGTYRNNLSGALLYRSFIPSDLLPENPPIIIDHNLDIKIKEAFKLLGKLDGITLSIPSKELFIYIYVRKEVLISSQIEGTQATLDDMFDPYIEINMNNDVEEVVNYLKALSLANDLLKTLPISLRYIKEIHKTLLTGQRGSEFQPGEFRQSQNWIGSYNSTIKTAKFIPPNPEDMHKSLANLELFIHNDDPIDSLLKIALIHYQFETIHPFLDGNGRIGRLLINVLLKEYGLINYDVLYLSYYFKKNQAKYYETLNNVRLNNDYEGWLLFFIEGIIETSNHAINSIHLILDLRSKNIKKITQLKIKQKNTVIELFEYLESHPIIDIKSASRDLNKAFNTISSSIDILVDLGILKQVQGKQRYRAFAYDEYLEILRDGTL